ncbi:TMV resistance protein N-like [Prunus yedoensis var. nudiflora]|uniref:TMV resistance protein N-like n=1 Tax=Prunus yedoensis var. nudiflora TaxID=2094558 RepID=A0A314YUQ0_PRUYE|nr:TMV resistance protein N-like [Prunus yedoensis var. nudiflora]
MKKVEGAILGDNNFLSSPESISQISELVEHGDNSSSELSLLRCSNLQTFSSLKTSIWNLASLKTSILRLSYLKSLSLPQRYIVEGEIPADIGFVLPSLQLLDLSANYFVSLPESISQLSKLRELHLFGCISLESLPKQLPLSIKFIDARHCPRLPTSKKLTIWNSGEGFSFMIFGSSDEDEDRTRPALTVHKTLADELFFFKYIEDRIYHGEPFEILAQFPRKIRIPNWCRHRMSGTSVSAQLPVDTEVRNREILFAISISSPMKVVVLNIP